MHEWVANQAIPGYFALDLHVVRVNVQKAGGVCQNQLASLGKQPLQKQEAIRISLDITPQSSGALVDEDNYHLGTCLS